MCAVDPWLILTLDALLLFTDPRMGAADARLSSAVKWEQFQGLVSNEPKFGCGKSCQTFYEWVLAFLNQLWDPHHAAGIIIGEASCKGVKC